MASALGHRLRRLQREAGARGGTAECPDDATAERRAAVDAEATGGGVGGVGASLPGLAERIARLRRRPDRTAELTDRLGAESVAEGVLRIRSRVALDGWGDGMLDAVGIGPESIPRLRFVDTETTGLAGGTGTTVFLFGTGVVRDDQLVLDQWLLLRPGAEPAFWAAVDAALGPAFELVTYNGKTFDWPLMVTRLRLNGVRVRVPAAHHDLVHAVRRAFATRWPDCRLSTCEARLLAAPRRGDLGGEFAPWAYREFLAGRAVAPLCRIVSHHHQDIRSLGRLLPALAAVYTDPAAHGADSLAVARHWLRRGLPERALKLLRGEDSAPARRLRADTLRRLGRWDAAVALWEGLAGRDDPEALEALAKYFEHRACEPRRALAFCRRLLELSPGDARHRHRLERLRRRIAGRPAAAASESGPEGHRSRGG